MSNCRTTLPNPAWKRRSEPTPWEAEGERVPGADEEPARSTSADRPASPSSDVDARRIGHAFLATPTGSAEVVCNEDDRKARVFLRTPACPAKIRKAIGGKRTCDVCASPDSQHPATCPSADAQSRDENPKRHPSEPSSETAPGVICQD